MEHFSIITTREFLNKIGNKSFILMTILLPIILSGIGFLLTFLSSINNDKSNGKIYELGGSRSYSWKEITRIISDACNKKKWRIPVPFSALKLCAFFFDRWSWFPFSREQLTMLSHGNVCESFKYFSEYDIDEISFSVKNLDYLS